MSVREFADKYIKAQNEAWNGNFGPLEEIEDPKVVVHNLGQGQERVGWEAHRQYLDSARAATTQRRIEWVYLVGEGNLFALSYKISAMATGKGPAPAGKRIEANSLFVVRLENGKVVESWSNGTRTVSDK